MRMLKLFLRAFFVLLILFFVAATIYVRIYGKSLVERALNVALKRNVVLGSATYHFPLGLRAYDVRIAQSFEGGELLEIKKVIAQLSPNAIFERKFNFDLVFLIEPSLVVTGAKVPENTAQAQAMKAGTVAPSSESGLLKIGESLTPAEDTNEDQMIEILIGRLIVKEGHLQYRDGLTEKGFSFDLEDVQLKAEHLVFPLKPGKSGFNMSARLVKKGTPLSGSRVNGSGWIDAVKRDMEAKIEVVEADGTVGLAFNALSKDNDMDVKGEINMHNFFGGVDKPASSDASAVNDLILNALSSAGVKIGVKFSFKTQMDHFRVGQVSFTGNVVTK